MRKQLIVISLNFAKAYDSIKREKVIETLMEHKIYPTIVEVIAELCHGDETNMEIAWEKALKVNVTSGIQEGCTGSASCKLITYKIIQRMRNVQNGYKDEMFKINSLFYADDGLILGDSMERANRRIES